MWTAPCFDIKFCQLLFADIAKITWGNTVKGAVFSTPYLIVWAHYARDSCIQGPIAMFSALKSISWKWNNVRFLPATATHSVNRTNCKGPTEQKLWGSIIWVYFLHMLLLQSSRVVQHCSTFVKKTFDVVKGMYKECKKPLTFHHNGPKYHSIQTF